MRDLPGLVDLAAFAAVVRRVAVVEAFAAFGFALAFFFAGIAWSLPAWPYASPCLPYPLPPLAGRHLLALDQVL